MKKSRIAICLLIVCTMIMSLFAAEAFAAGSLTPETPAKFTIQTKYGSSDPNPVAGIPYRIYHVADIDNGPVFTLTEEFKDCGIKLKGDSANEWDSVAELIKGYAQANSIEPVYTLSSDENGTVIIDGIDTGLYLVVGERTTVGSYTYSVKPGIVTVPNFVDGAWNYDVTMLPKIERFNNPDKPDNPEPPAKQTVDRKALKIWEDDGNEEKRPDDITVHLLRDGEVYATETLNEANGWSCEWRGLTSLDKDGNTYEWNLIEDAVEGYSPTMEQSGITFVLTNTYEEEIPEDPTPLAPAEPGKPGEPGEPLEELPEDPVPLAMLPQTGMLWWPVPVMGLLGVMFLALGASFRRRENA